MTNRFFQKLSSDKNTLESAKLTVVLVLANIFVLTVCVGGWASNDFAKYAPQQTGKMVEKRHGARTEPIQIVEPSVNGVPIELGREFDASSDWIKNLRLKIKNKYVKPITFIRLDLDFPETSRTGPIMMHQLYLGQREDIKFTENNPPLSLQPNGEKEISLEPEFNSIKRLIEHRQGPVENINHLVVRVGEVMFEDGTLYTAGGDFWRSNPDPNSPHKWILITPEPTKP